MGVETTPTWTKLGNHASEIASKTHLKTLLNDGERTKSLTYTHNGVYIDFSRQNATVETQSVGFQRLYTMLWFGGRITMGMCLYCVDVAGSGEGMQGGGEDCTHASGRSFERD